MGWPVTVRHRPQSLPVETLRTGTFSACQVAMNPEGITGGIGEDLVVEAKARWAPTGRLSVVSPE
jgi:hypothetical protein